NADAGDLLVAELRDFDQVQRATRGGGGEESGDEKETACIHGRKLEWSDRPSYNFPRGSREGPAKDSSVFLPPTNQTTSVSTPAGTRSGKTPGSRSWWKRRSSDRPSPSLPSGRVSAVTAALCRRRSRNPPQIN